MAEYNFNDINEAKKRVREMQSRAKGVSHEEKSVTLSSMLCSLENPKEIALALFILYIIERESVSEELLSLILGILL